MPEAIVAWLHDYRELTGWLSGIVIGILVALVFARRPVLRRFDTRHDMMEAARAARIWTVLVCVTSVLALLSAAPFVLSFFPISPIEVPASAATSSPARPSTVPPTLPSVTPVPQVGALPESDGTCPTPRDARAQERVTVEIYWWCTAPAVNAEGEWDYTPFQLKMRLGITANPRGSGAVVVQVGAPSSLRFLIPYTKDVEWNPPPKTKAGGGQALLRVYRRGCVLGYSAECER